MNIKWIQKDLNFLGYNAGIEDGIQGKNTTRAIKLYQEQHNLAVDGIAGKNTQSTLIEEIKNEQMRLGVLQDGLAGAETIRVHNEKCDWKNIKNFKKSEFTCKCGCGLNLEYYEVVKIADDIRNEWHLPVIVTSGTRCQKHNKEVGGVANSRHLKGKAIDFYINGVSSKQLIETIKRYMSKKGIRYTYRINNSCCHMDIL